MAGLTKKNNIDTKPPPVKYLEEGRKIHEEDDGPEVVDHEISGNQLLDDAMLNNHTAELQHEKTSCWEQTVDNLIRFRNKTTTFRLIYLIALAFALSLLIALVFMFIPIAENNHEIAAHLEQTSLLVKDCRSNAEFLNKKNQELQDKLQRCDKAYLDLSALLKTKTAEMGTLQSRVESLQNQIWDLNAQIMAKDNKIFHLATYPEGKEQPGFFGMVASLFSAGSAVVPSYQIIAGFILFVFFTAS